MRLWVDGDVPARLARLLKTAGKRLALAPAPTGTSRNHEGDLVLTCPLPVGWKPRMNAFADRLQLRVSQTGQIFEISEVGNGIAGGLMGSCMPVATLEMALKAWLSTHALAQLELFSDPRQRRNLR